MPRASIEDPLKLLRYKIVIDGFVRMGFNECSGLTRDTDVAEYREGGQNETPQKSAGLTKFPDITLKRGQIVQSSRGGDDDFVDWAAAVYRATALGNAENYRKDMDVEQFNAMNVKVRVWRVYNAWPKTFKATGDFNGTSSENSIEELVLTHEGWDKVL